MRRRTQNARRTRRRRNSDQHLMQTLRTLSPPLSHSPSHSVVHLRQCEPTIKARRFPSRRVFLFYAPRMSETISERHASACRYKNEIPAGSRRSARRTHFRPRGVYSPGRKRQNDQRAEENSIQPNRSGVWKLPFSGGENARNALSERSCRKRLIFHRVPACGADSSIAKRRQTSQP